MDLVHRALLLLHLLAVIVWVGGMVFAHFFLRPAAQSLEPPLRVQLMQGVLQRFLGAVGGAVAVVLASGVWMIGRAARQAAQAGGFSMPPGWAAMAVLGLVMAAIFGHIRFALFPRLRRAVAAADWPAGGKALADIRRWVAVNLALGSLTVAIAVLL